MREIVNGSAKDFFMGISALILLDINFSTVENQSNISPPFKHGQTKYLHLES